MNDKRREDIKRLAYRILSISFWLSLWEIISRVWDQKLLLPAPSGVLLTLIDLSGSLDFWQTILNSFLKILLGFILAIILGTIMAILSYISRFFYELISPIIKVIKVTPVASFIILALIWVKSSYLSVLISFLMVVPIVYTNILEGLNETDQRLLDMAKVFRLSTGKKIKAIYFPATIGYFISAISVGLGFSFKSGIAAEIIGKPANSIGGRLYEAKLYFLTEEMFAWTLLIIIISLVFEKLVMKLINGIYQGRSKIGGYQTDSDL